MPIYPLRPYQLSAVQAAVNWIKYKPTANAYIKAAGGAGKSLMIAGTAEACFDMNSRVIILARSEKLLTQNKAKFAEKYQDHIGVYCDGLKEKDLSKPITIASIQSICTKGKELKVSRILIDETQNLHPDPESETQYWNFIRDLGNPQIIGYTATDYRVGSGLLKFGEKIADIPFQMLVDNKYLCPPTNKAVQGINLSNVQIIRGEYNGEQLESIYLEPELLTKSLEVLQKYTQDRHSVVIFTQSRKHGKILQQAMLDNGMDTKYVDGELDKKKELNPILEDFENRKFKYLINVDMLVEGWDCPPADCVVVLRSTISKGFFEQMLYRTTRLHLPLSEKYKEYLVKRL